MKASSCRGQIFTSRRRPPDKREFLITNLSISAFTHSFNKPQSILIFGVDIGAPKSVTGMPNVLRILRELNLEVTSLHYSNNQFRFGDTVVKSLGTISFLLATPPGIPSIPVLYEIVVVDVPALLGLPAVDDFVVYRKLAMKILGVRAMYIDKTTGIEWLCMVTTDKIHAI